MKSHQPENKETKSGTHAPGGMKSRRKSPRILNPKARLLPTWRQIAALAPMLPALVAPNGWCKSQSHCVPAQTWHCQRGTAVVSFVKGIQTSRPCSKIHPCYPNPRHLFFGLLWQRSYRTFQVFRPLHSHYLSSSRTGAVRTTSASTPGWTLVTSVSWTPHPFPQWASQQRRRIVSQTRKPKLLGGSHSPQLATDFAKPSCYSTQATHHKKQFQAKPTLFKKMWLHEEVLPGGQLFIRKNWASGTTQ